jgi:hypothetical protein
VSKRRKKKSIYFEDTCITQDMSNCLPETSNTIIDFPVYNEAGNRALGYMPVQLMN